MGYLWPGGGRVAGACKPVIVTPAQRFAGEDRDLRRTKKANFENEETRRSHGSTAFSAEIDLSRNASEPKRIVCAAHIVLATTFRMGRNMQLQGRSPPAGTPDSAARAMSSIMRTSQTRPSNLSCQWSAKASLQSGSQAPVDFRSEPRWLPPNRCHPRGDNASQAAQSPI